MGDRPELPEADVNAIKWVNCDIAAVVLEVASCAFRRFRGPPSFVTLDFHVCLRPAKQKTVPLHPHEDATNVFS
eukprot:3179849-Amphidinium_carterae.1